MLRHLPNLISLLRIALVAPLILAILQERYEVALVIAAVAGVSDGVDGFLARHFRWQSRLGSILDPVAAVQQLRVPANEEFMAQHPILRKQQER